MSIHETWTNNNRSFQGYAPNQQPVQMKAKFTTYNTKEDEKILQGAGDGFTLKPSPLAKAVARCFHRDPNTKMFTTYPTNDGTGMFRCSHCGALMHDPDQTTYEVAKKAFDEFKAYWETIKSMDINCTEEVANSFYILMAYLEPWPEMVKYVEREFDRYFTMVGGNQVRQDTFYVGGNGFNTFDAIMGNRPVQPMYGNNVGNVQGYPGYGGVPMSSTNMQAANMVGGNPFATGYQQPAQQQPIQQPIQQPMYNNPYQPNMTAPQNPYQQAYQEVPYPVVTEIPPMLNNGNTQPTQQPVPTAPPVAPQPTQQPAVNNNGNTKDGAKIFSI